MGTNYYAVEKSYKYNRNEIHIGKSSGGWKFLFHSCDEFRTFPQFKHWLEECVDTEKYLIFNEYGENVSKDELLELIESKQKTDSPDQYKYCMDIDGYRFSDRDFS